MTKERTGSLIFFIAGIYGLVFSIGFPFGKLTEPGPGVFPFSISVLLIISGILMFVRGKEKEAVDRTGLIRQLVTPIQIVGITAAFILVVERLGYLVSAFVYLFIIFLWICRYRLWTAIGLAGILGIGTWYFFVKILVIQLPGGILPL